MHESSHIYCTIFHQGGGLSRRADRTRGSEEGILATFLRCCCPLVANTHMYMCICNFLCLQQVQILWCVRENLANIKNIFTPWKVNQLLASVFLLLEQCHLIPNFFKALHIPSTSVKETEQKNHQL